MRSSSSRLALLLSFSALAACAPLQPERVRVAEAIDARHQRELRAFEAEKARIERSDDDLRVFELGSDGVLVVQDVELIGWPSAAYLRVEYTYVNTSDSARKAPAVTLTVVDPATGEDSWVTEEGVLPLGLRLQPESTYSSWIEVPTHGLHQRDGWTWELSAE